MKNGPRSRTNSGISSLFELSNSKNFFQWGLGQEGGSGQKAVGSRLTRGWWKNVEVVEEIGRDGRNWVGRMWKWS